MGIMHDNNYNGIKNSDTYICIYIYIYILMMGYKEAIPLFMCNFLGGDNQFISVKLYHLHRYVP